MPDNGAVATLTDGTGISAITGSKLLKDFVLDILLAVPAGFLAINVGSIEAALVAPAAVAFVVGDAGVKALYRVLLRWAQS
jgi:hypothetical protein